MSEVDSKPFSSKYDIKEELGKGAFSIVKKAVQKDTKDEFAVKIINTRKLTSRDVQKLEREVRVCRLLKHENIVQLHQVFQEHDVRYMVFDLITGGELFDDIVAREFYSEKDASHCIQQILESVQYCHENRIIHRDIKPENLLLASRTPGANVKLADFGLAVEAMDARHYYGFAGTPGYLSPEVLRKEPYSYPVDTWACGVVLYILLVGYPPFWDDNQAKMFEQIKKGRFDYPAPEWDTVTSSAKDLINKMMTGDQLKRITANEALQHPWIKNRDKEASKVHRQETITVLRKFNARRKLKAAAHTVFLVTKRSSTFFSSRANKPTTPAEVTVQEEDSGSHTAEEKEIVQVTQRLINSIADKDYKEYSKLCTEDMTCFEPEACAQLVTGMEFHKFYFDHLPASPSAIQQSMITPKVQMLGDSGAYCAYIRLIQTVNKEGVAHSVSIPETRIWQKFGGDWKCVHSHRSAGGANPARSPDTPSDQ
ncbi:calcium/calmodulin-dependent protein kinase type II-like [Halichondria panicea]|uniref:calcium/calmodulin-dependent protein kinase type II-like n=1 Tax=Halichondria panicea TaxID=6063 RepID=UPI00312B2BEB